MNGGVTFDLSINLGNVITVLVGVVTLTLAWSKLGGRLTMLEYRVTTIETTLKDISTVLKTFSTNEKELALTKQTLTSHEAQIALLQEAIEGLRRGEGYIIGPRRGNLEGEYSRVEYERRGGPG